MAIHMERCAWERLDASINRTVQRGGEGNEMNPGEILKFKPSTR